MGRTIFIGDIHGCYDELTQLLDKLRLQPDDRVVAVGDLTVKGPKSAEVLDLFANDFRFASVAGNHDLALVRHWGDKNKPLNKAQARAFHELKTQDDRYFQYLASLPFFIDLGSHVVVHAGVRPGIPLEKQSSDDLVELRTLGEDRTSREGTPWYDAYEGPATVLFGHWPAPLPRLAAHAIGLDTGCVYGGLLTAYVLESGEFVSVSAAENYDSSGSIPPAQSIKSVHS
jgi:Calcineurin-like phosphoesterase